MHTRVTRQRHGSVSFCGAAVGLVMLTALCGCGSDDTDDREAGPDTTRPEASTSLTSVAAPTTLPADVTTTQPAPTSSTESDDAGTTTSAVDYPLELDGLTVAAPQPPYGHVVGIDDGFLRVSTTLDGATTVATSATGDSFDVVDSDLSIPRIAGLGAGEDVVVAVGIDERSAQLAVWTSDATGGRWTALPAPSTPATSNELIIAASWVQSVAVAGDRIVMTVVENQMIDWEAYATDVLGESHGAPRGTSMDGNTNTVTVMYADGTDVLVDLAELGISDPAAVLGGPPSPVVQTFDGTSWTRTPQPTWTTSDSTFEVVAGPAGFAVLAQEGGLPATGLPTGGPVGTDIGLPTGAPAGTMMMLSKDGIQWSAHPIEAMPAGVGGALAGGVHGYINMTGSAIWYSSDGISWQKVHDIPTANPSMMAMTMSSRVAGGDAGFAAIAVDFAGDVTEQTATALWSPDGRTWNSHDITDPEMVGWAAAVDATAALVVPEPRWAASGPELPEDDDALIDLLASTLDPATQYAADADDQRDFPPLSDVEARCIAEAIVSGVGGDRIRERRPYERAEAEIVVDAYRGCTPDWKWLLAFGITEGADWLSAETMACVQATLDDDDARALFIEERDVGSDRSSPEHQALHEPMIDALDECATDQELNALDWN